MSNQPGWGAPQQPYAPTPQPPRKTGAGKVVGLSCLGVLVACLLIAVVAVAAFSDGDGGSNRPDTSVAATPGETAEEPGEASKSEEKAGSSNKEEAKPEGDAKATSTQAQRFKTFVEKNGTPTEKEAVRHVTKVQGADEQNDIMDAAEVFTDYSGGMMGTHANDGKLIASAFADWRDSENGLVTVYDKDGEILSNGNF
ncbi:hypothetical protein H181DRAFT_02286 [Streptomyces sp. WMMB 714]|uniref:hypothetical protein n=1 Tax=Streptomyces sp. WMMB 714 TaxID=1286822 RepID=UPI000823CF89|nr:hypothetical protein [Streptomyces sp. WMMB 714]SCK29166.1 hypothetical protein H181DRAFT_02286 [Streptomyces sp. WMMB 714]